MADINVEKKKRPVWPWILAILIAAAVIWVIADNGDEYGEEVATVDTEQEYEERQNTQDTLYRDRERDRNRERDRDRAEQDAAMAYVSFIEENGDEVTKSHEYSSQALTHLSKAVKEVAQENNVSIENKNELDNLQEKADKLTREKSSTKHANILANAFNSAARVINNIQEEEFPNLEEEANEVKNAADKIKPNVVATNQKDAIKNFYEKSATALEEMNQDERVSMK